MTEGQTLLALLAFIYVTDCYLVLDRHSIVLITWWGRRWAVETASSTWGSSNRSLLLLNPIPPFGSFFLNQLIPVSISPSHITDFNSQTIAAGGRPSQSGSLISLSDIGSVSVRGRELWLNGCQFCRCKTSEVTVNLANLLEKLRISKAAEREPLIESFWSAQMDATAIKTEINSLRSQTTVLRVLCIIQFIYLFVILPFVLSVSGVSSNLIPAAIVMLVLAVQIAIEYSIIHRKSHSAHAQERLSNVIRMILCPPISIRAVDLLMVTSCQSQNILALASSLLPSPLAHSFLSQMLRDLRYPVGMSSFPPTITEVCQWQNTTIARVAQASVPGAAICIEALDDEPKKEDPLSKKYCPRCQLQLTTCPSTCPDCLGVSMKSFSSLCQQGKF